MKLNTPEYGRAPNKALLLLSLGLAIAASIPTRAPAQQAQTAPLSTASDPAKKNFTEEWVYRAQYGHKDEWWQIFKKYQIAILERQKQLGYVKDFTVWAPGLHTDESSRWDYRVVIVRASYDAPPGQSEEDVAKHIFPDQAQFKHDEDRRWELTANHWDLPIHQVKLEGAD